MCLLLDHGLRAGELAGLETDTWIWSAGGLRFFRPKVGKVQTHRLSPDTLRAVRACAAHGELPAAGRCCAAARRRGAGRGRDERARHQRAGGSLGKRIGLFGLSRARLPPLLGHHGRPHGTDPFALQEAGGWSSLAMPRRYIEDSQVANEGVKLGQE